MVETVEDICIGFWNVIFLLFPNFIDYDYFCIPSPATKKKLIYVQSKVLNERVALFARNAIIALTSCDRRLIFIIMTVCLIKPAAFVVCLSVIQGRKNIYVFLLWKTGNGRTQRISEHPIVPYDELSQQTVMNFIHYVRRKG